MSTLLPIFPLQIVLYPNENLNLHIFEARYKQLINHCSTQKTTFGIPTVLDGKLAGYGTEAAIKDIINVYPDGRLDITVQGLRRFKIYEYVGTMPDMLCDGANVEWLGEDWTVDLQQQKRLAGLIRDIYQALQLSKPGLTDKEVLTSYEVAHYLGMSLEQEYGLLTIPTEAERLKFLIVFLKKIIPTLESVDRLKERVAMNGHFRHFDPLDFNF